MPPERLLVIDDSKEARDFLEEYLGHYGYSVLTACDGEEGLLRALNDHPDVILVDMQMPKMTGLEVIEALNCEERDIPVIFMTAYGSEELAVQAFRAGACDYVPKPYEPQMILDSIERALHSVRLRKERDQVNSELAQASQALQRQLQQLKTLYTVGQSITSLLDLEQVLVRVVEAATFLTRVKEGSLMLLDASNGELYVRAAKDAEGKAARGVRIRVGDSLATRVIRTGRPLLVTGEELERVTTLHLVKAVAMVPLQTPERGVFGVLMVASKDGERALGQHHLPLLAAMAGYAAAAIDKAAVVANLKTEKNKLETILRETAEAIIVVDEYGCITLCNQAARSAFGLVDDDILGSSLENIIANQELLNLWARHSDANALLQAEISLTDGRTLNACISAIDGIGYAMVMHDITHLKEVDRIKSEFVSAVSHDLRTPLTTIQGYIDLLPRAGSLTEGQEEYVARAQRSLSAVSQLVSDLLEISRIETDSDLDMVTTELKPVIIEAVDELRPKAEAKEHSLQVRMPEYLPLITGSPRRLRQVISNLVGNAVKYTPSGGHILVEVTEGENHIKISVTDDGLGIPIADQPYVFDKFFRVSLPETRSIPGIGLGLAIVKSVVEKHGGRVWVESEPGVGSTFTILLPKQF